MTVTALAHNIFVLVAGRDLVNMAKKRPNIIPIIEDARHPQKYRMLVPMVDVVFAGEASSQLGFHHIYACPQLGFVRAMSSRLMQIEVCPCVSDHLRLVHADVAQPDQARIVGINAQYFLKNSGNFVISIKASCIDSTAPPEAVFAREVRVTCH